MGLHLFRNSQTRSFAAGVLAISKYLLCDSVPPNRLEVTTNSAIVMNMYHSIKTS